MSSTITGVVDDDVEVYPYELVISVKRANITGGGLPNSSYVEIYIDGALMETTDVAPPPAEWNNHIIKGFHKLEPPTPIIISFSVYKKKWTSSGFKLVGSTQFPLTDLINKLNIGPIDKVFSLSTPKKNLSMSGAILVGLELYETKANIQDTDDKMNKFKGPFFAILYRIFFDFKNIVFGRLVKMLLLILWLLLLLKGYYQMISIQKSVSHFESSADVIQQSFQALLNTQSC